MNSVVSLNSRAYYYFCVDLNIRFVWRQCIGEPKSNIQRDFSVYRLICESRQRLLANIGPHDSSSLCSIFCYSSNVVFTFLSHHTLCVSHMNNNNNNNNHNKTMCVHTDISIYSLVGVLDTVGCWLLAVGSRDLTFVDTCTQNSAIRKFHLCLYVVVHL